MNTHILIVDDNQENLKVVSSNLKEKGYKIALALNGQSAIKIAQTTPIDLILLDIMMPEMDGYEVCKTLKSSTTTLHIPILFLSAKNDTDDIAECYNSGGEDYIPKPFRKEELFARVHHTLLLKKVKDLIQYSKDNNTNITPQLAALFQQED